MSNVIKKSRLIIFFVLILYSITYSQNLFVKFKDFSRQETSIKLVAKQNIQFISINDFAGVFNARTYYNHLAHKLNVYLYDKVITITAFNPFITIDNHIFQLTTDTFLGENEIYVPLNDFIDLITGIIPDEIILNKESGIMEVFPSKRMNIRFINIVEKSNGYLIRIQTTQNFKSSDISLRERHNWLYVDIYGGKVDSLALSKTFEGGLISRIVPHQVSDETAQLGFRLKEKTLEKQCFLDNPGEILISLKTKKNISSEIKRELEQEKKKWLIDKIVIDPGHGGKDPGAVGRSSYEKNITLAIALELKRLIQANTNIKVLMTRDDDNFVELKHRTEFANRNQAKLFISIHANSNTNRRLKGVSTYFLGPGNTDEAREVALLENSVIKYENESKYADLTTENFILSAMAQNQYNSESEDLAAIVQHEISRRCGLINRGVKQAGFYVLWGSSMPNILIETAFISNHEEEKKLNSPTFQKKIAKSVYEAIRSFKRKYEQGI